MDHLALAEPLDKSAATTPTESVKLLSLWGLSALTLGLALARCEAQLSDGSTTMGTALGNAAMTHDEFLTRQKSLDEQGDWSTLLQLGRDWQTGHPDDYEGHYSVARVSFMLGDLDLSIAEYQKSVALNPSAAETNNSWLEIARKARRNYPDLQLHPLRYVIGDVAREQEEWQQKGGALLLAKRYDEIEKTAAALQHSNAADIQGVPHLKSFFNGLCTGGDFAARQGRIAAWRAARPASNLARIAALQLWSNAAREARGGGFASSITPDMKARMDAALAKGAQSLKALPSAAFKSPLAFDAMLRWGLLASAPREFFDHFFQEGTATFPDYLPFYTQRAQVLLPRWFGEPGEWEAMAKKRAGQIGGDNGDVFYGRIVWSLSQLVFRLPKESHFDYERARRGLEILQKRSPDSVSLLSARLDTAFESKDWTTAKQIFTAPQGYVLDDSWWLWAPPRNKPIFDEQRVLILGDSMS